MELEIVSRFRKAWNTFMSRDPTADDYDGTVSYSSRPHRITASRKSEKTIISPIYNRIAVDAAQISIRHVRLDKKKRYLEDINSPLNDCLTWSANIDQTGRAFRQDIFQSLMDEGVIAIVPTDTSRSPFHYESFDIYSMRVGKVVEWKPTKVKVSCYNERTGKHEDIWVPKSGTAIVENPFYSVMNEPNSVLKRLTRKLALLDAVDEQSSSGKLDLIIQLPYVVKSQTRKAQAEARRKDIEDQLLGSKYGIAYTDGTERITQLNRPIENNLMKQVEYLTSTLHGQLGITPEIMDGTADEKTMLNYYNRTIEVFVSAVVDEMKRSFISKTARTQNQSIMFFRDMFKLTPVEQLAELADKFTRNEIATSNEFRQILGWVPSDDPKADQLKNSNMPDPGNGQDPAPPADQPEQPEADVTNETQEEIQNG